MERQKGLCAAEVKAMQDKGLVNQTNQTAAKSTAAIFRDNICTLFNLFNFLIAVALAFVGAWTNLFFLLIILLNISIGIFQEIKGKKLVEKLSVLSQDTVTVIRDGQPQEISNREIVLGDTVILSAGEQICADAAVTEGELEVNESLLTGESEPVKKRNGDALLSGSFVISGKAAALVEKVGAENFAVKLAAEAKKYKKTNSELLKSMRKVTKFTGFLILPIGVLLFCTAYFLRGNALFDSVVSSSAALLGMLPKGLVLLISIALATGVITLAKKKVLVQQPYAIETLARTDILCLDKTGTITTGNMRISAFIKNESATLPLPAEKLLGLFTANSLDNNATAAALSAYFSPADSHSVRSRTAFSSDRKWSGVSFEHLGTVVVGAPEKLLQKFTGKLPDSFADIGRDGQRVLYAAFYAESMQDDTLPASLTVFAAIEICDPIRSGAKETLAWFKSQGVAVKVISGDNPDTVSLVAKRAGLDGWDRKIDMSKVESEQQLLEAAKNFTVFGRVTPSQKKQLVAAFQRQNKSVAMVGDGVNDVLALRQADCGIALAAGSGASKQVSQIVLTESDFTALPAVVAEGRRVINNITKVSGIFFIKTIYSVLLSVLFLILNLPFPFIPIQITLIDLAIEGYPSLFLSFEKEYGRQKGSFLQTAIKNALPFAILILAAVCVLTVVQKITAIPQEEITTAAYLVLGFISALAVIKACLPPNKLRIFLAVTSTVGFFTAVLLFSIPFNLLKLTFPPLSLIWIPLVMMAASIPLLLLLIKSFSKAVTKKSDDKNYE